MAIMIIHYAVEKYNRSYPAVIVWDIDNFNKIGNLDLKVYIGISKYPVKTFDGKNQLHVKNSGTAWNDYREFYTKTFTDILLMEDKDGYFDAELKRGGKIAYKGNIFKISKSPDIEEKTVTIKYGTPRLQTALNTGNKLSGRNYTAVDVHKLKRKINSINFDNLKITDYQNNIIPIKDFISTIVQGLVVNEFKLKID